MAKYGPVWRTVGGVKMQSEALISVPTSVKSWLTNAFSTTLTQYHATIVAQFSPDEALGAITTPQQYLSIKTVEDIVDLNGLDEEDSVRFWPSSFLNFPRGMLVPRNEVATNAYREGLVARPDARARIEEELAFQEQALLPWVKAKCAIAGMCELITEPAQVVHYMPWLEQCGVRSTATYAGSNETRRWVEPIRNCFAEPKPPKTYIPLSPEQRDYLTAGKTALATWGLIKDQTRQEDNTCAKLWLDVSSIKLLDPWA